MLIAEPTSLFVFGDNAQRRGLGGQAKEMRGEHNAVGIPTKHSPSMHQGSFFIDSDLDYFIEISRSDFKRLFYHTNYGGTVVWPLDNIGTGLARLPERAPKIFQLIEDMKRGLSYP